MEVGVEGGGEGWRWGWGRGCGCLKVVGGGRDGVEGVGA